MKENARFYSSLGLLVILNIIIKPVWIFGIDRQVQNSVGTVEYGLYFSLFNLSLVFAFILDAGLTGYFNRQLASKQEKFIDQVGNFLFLKLLFSLLYVGVVLACAMLTGVERWDILRGVIIIQLLTYLFVFLRTIVTAMQWFRTDAWLSILDKSLMIIFCGTLFYSPSLLGSMSISKFLYFQVASTAVAVLVAGGILVRRKIVLSLRAFSSFLNRELFYSALPYALLILLMSAHFRLDGFLLERIHPDGAKQAGIYAASYRLLDAANMIGFLFASFVLPYIARQWNAKNDIGPVILNIRHLLLVLSFALSCFTIFFAPWIQQLLYHSNDPGSIVVMQWCLPAIIGYSLVSIYGTVMTATGHIYPFCWITLGAVLLNTTLNLLLIPEMGAKACCIAALASQGAAGMATLLYTRIKLNVPVHPRSLFIYICIAALLFGSYYLAGDRVNPWLMIVVSIMITGIIVLLTGLIRWRSIKLFLKPGNLKS